MQTMFLMILCKNNNIGNFNLFAQDPQHEKFRFEKKFNLIKINFVLKNSSQNQLPKPIR